MSDRCFSPDLVRIHGAISPLRGTPRFQHAAPEMSAPAYGKPGPGAARPSSPRSHLSTLVRARMLEAPRLSRPVDAGLAGMPGPALCHRSARAPASAAIDHKGTRQAPSLAQSTRGPDGCAGHQSEPAALTGKDHVADLSTMADFPDLADLADLGDLSDLPEPDAALTLAAPTSPVPAQGTDPGLGPVRPGPASKAASGADSRLSAALAALSVTGTAPEDLTKTFRAIVARPGTSRPRSVQPVTLAALLALIGSHAPETASALLRGILQGLFENNGRAGGSDLAAAKRLLLAQWREQPRLHTAPLIEVVLSEWGRATIPRTGPGASESAGLKALAHDMVDVLLPATPWPDLTEQAIATSLEFTLQRTELAQAFVRVLCDRSAGWDAVAWPHLIRAVANVLHARCARHDVARDLGELIGRCARSPRGPNTAAWHGVLDNCLAPPEPEVRAMLTRHALETWLGDDDTDHVAFCDAFHQRTLDPANAKLIATLFNARMEQRGSAAATDPDRQREPGAATRNWPISRPFAQPIPRPLRPSRGNDAGTGH